MGSGHLSLLIIYSFIKSSASFVPHQGICSAFSVPAVRAGGVEGGYCLRLCQSHLIGTNQLRPRSSLSLSNNNGRNRISETEPTELMVTVQRKMLNLLGKSTSAVVSGIFFAALAYRRDLFIVTMFVGAIGNAILSKILKKIINQTRPPAAAIGTASDKLGLKPSDGGMPSSHAMSLGFIGTFTCLHLPTQFLFLKPVIIAYAVTSLVYRVHAQLHTWQQVLVGSSLGITNGFLWYTCAFPAAFERMDIFTNTLHIFNDQGILPLPFLVIPAIVGLLVVGSVERRIGNWVKAMNDSDAPIDKED